MPYFLFTFMFYYDIEIFAFQEFWAKSELLQLDKMRLSFPANVAVALRKVITSEKKLLQNFLETSH